VLSLIPRYLGNVDKVLFLLVVKGVFVQFQPVVHVFRCPPAQVRMRLLQATRLDRLKSGAGGSTWRYNGEPVRVPEGVKVLEKTNRE